ncbi:MAG: hypothetical protein KAW12_16145 [Candidatus Aminicenantes bacterium]|nr:hypothetical protein [Candidatus Aminicenantes bacterium]
MSISKKIYFFDGEFGTGNRLGTAYRDKIAGSFPQSSMQLLQPVIRRPQGVARGTDKLLRSKGDDSASRSTKDEALLVETL